MKKKKWQRSRVCKKCGYDRFRTVRKGVLTECRGCGFTFGYCFVNEGRNGAQTATAKRGKGSGRGRGRQKRRFGIRRKR